VVLSKGVMAVAKGASVAFALVPKMAFLPPQLLRVASRISGIAHVSLLVCTFIFCIPIVVFVAIELVRCFYAGKGLAES
jgi:hypothetical protein